MTKHVSSQIKVVAFRPRQPRPALPLRMGADDPVVSALGYLIDLTVRAGLTGWISRSLQAPVICQEVPACPPCPGFSVESVQQICPERRDVELNVYIGVLLITTPALLLVLVGFALGRWTSTRTMVARPAAAKSSTHV